MKSVSLVLILLVFFTSTWAAPEATSIKVVALFTNKAMLNINGQRIIMKNGDTVQGITLISATGRGAVVRLENGTEKSLGINQSIHQAYKKPINNKLRLYSDSAGMFTLSGDINGRHTRFLLDTGATYIAISSEEADRLKLSYKSAKQGFVQTASEVVPVWHIKLDKVKVKDISVSNVDAVVLKGSNPMPSLLGMSFLKHVRLERDGAAMIIEQRY